MNKGTRMLGNHAAIIILALAIFTSAASAKSISKPPELQELKDRSTDWGWEPGDFLNFLFCVLLFLYLIFINLYS